MRAEAINIILLNTENIKVDDLCQTDNRTLTPIVFIIISNSPSTVHLETLQIIPTEKTKIDQETWH